MCGVRVAQLAVEGSAHGVGWEDEHLRTPVEEVVVGDLDHRGRLAAAGAVHDEHARVGQALRPAEERHGLLVRLQARLLLWLGRRRRPCCLGLWLWLGLGLRLGLGLGLGLGLAHPNPNPNPNPYPNPNLQARAPLAGARTGWRGRRRGASARARTH